MMVSLGMNIFIYIVHVSQCVMYTHMYIPFAYRHTYVDTGSYMYVCVSQKPTLDIFLDHSLHR